MDMFLKVQVLLEGKLNNFLRVLKELIILTYFSIQKHELQLEDGYHLR